MVSIKNEIAVGIFFFMALIILGYFTIIMSGEIFNTKDYYFMSVIFPNIEGLGKTAKVKVNGVTSGIVDDVELMDNNNVFVNLKMYNKFTLYKNYKIRIKNETALGGKYVGINPGIDFLDGKVYASIKSLENLKGKGSGDIFSELTDFIAENRANVYQSINNIKKITAKINSGNGTIGKLINENKVHDDTDNLIQEVRDAMEDTREQAPITSFLRAALLAF